MSKNMISIADAWRSYPNTSLKRSRDRESSARVANATLTPPSSNSEKTANGPHRRGKTCMDTNFDLPDSTDWHLTSLPAFEPLEAALRCEVCKEFLSNPVITSCSHTFCSICIRRCIATDGRCPSCKSACSSDKLAPNIAVREVVMRFQEARPKALEMARAEKESEKQAQNRKKRKIDETDIEDSEPARQTRSRATRSSSRRDGAAEDPIEVMDSEDDGDAEFLPEGMAKCPICNNAMKAEQVFPHLDSCPGPDASQGRSTRSRTKTTIPTALQRRKKDPSPPPTRLSQLNYAMTKESVLRKKLQEIGIPNWGSKDLMRRRHIEWLNIYNSNCDAHETVRKSKRQLLKELEEWENTQGGNANSKENKIMKKDFDGDGYAKSHKSDFDDLIAKARQKRAVAKKDEASNEGESKEGTSSPQQNGTSAEDSQPQSLETTSNSSQPQSQPETPHQQPPNLAPDQQPPCANNPTAISTIRDKVDQVNLSGSTLASVQSEDPIVSNASNHEVGLPNPLGNPARKVPMFAMPEQPVRDVDTSSTVQ